MFGNSKQEDIYSIFHFISSSCSPPSSPPFNRNHHHYHHHLNHPHPHHHYHLFFLFFIHPHKAEITDKQIHFIQTILYILEQLIKSNKSGRLIRKLFASNYHQCFLLLQSIDYYLLAVCAFTVSSKIKPNHLNYRGNKRSYN